MRWLPGYRLSYIVQSEAQRIVSASRLGPLTPDSVIEQNRYKCTPYFVIDCLQCQPTDDPTIVVMDHPADIVVRFGERVRHMRKSRGWTQEDFAAKSGLPRPYFADIERGAVSVGLRNLEVIAKTFGVTVSELTDGIDSSSGSSG